MTVMNFPSSPNLGDEYIFNNTTYIWDGVKWVAQKPNEQNMNQLLEAHKNGIDQHPISGIQGLADALASAGDPVLDVKWLTKRSPMRTGYTAGDGQTLSRALYPDAFAAIQAGLVPVCTDAEWLANPAKRGCFTLGDGSTTFRVPDYNGAQSGSYGPVYLGGGSSVGGAILRDRVGKHRHATAFQTTLADSGFPEGAKPITLPQSGNVSWTANAGTSGRYASTFDGSAEGFTGETTRPITAEGCIAIKLFGAVQNTGSADAAALATAVADLSARMSVVEAKVASLEQRKSTCLVNATGTGAPHETVVATLPATVGPSTRIVLPNPFGAGTPVDVEVEVFLNSQWGKTGFIYYGGVGLGTYGGYSQTEGVIIQTGVYTASDSTTTGGVHNFRGGNITTALPVRVFVTKQEA